MFLLTTDDYFNIPDDPALDFAAAESFTAIGVVRYNFTGAHSTLISKGPTGAQGWTLYKQTNENVYLYIHDGTTATFDQSAASVATRELTSLVGRRNVATDNVASGIGTPEAGVTDTTTGTLATANVLRIGASSPTFSVPLEGQIIAVALWREALTDAEIAAVSAELTGSGVPQMMLMGVG